MSTAMELAFQQAHAATAYSVVGETVTYESVSGTSTSVIAVISDASDSVAGGFSTAAIDGEVTARLLKAVITSPRRGDKIVRNSVVYEVDTYSQLNAVEWLTVLRKCTDG